MKTIEVSLDTYERFETLKETLEELTQDTNIKDEDVVEFMVREITESIKMMQEHSHEWGCFGWEHCHEEGKDEECCGGHDCCKHE